MFCFFLTNTDLGGKIHRHFRQLIIFYPLPLIKAHTYKIQTLDPSVDPDSTNHIRVQVKSSFSFLHERECQISSLNEKIIQRGCGDQLRTGLSAHAPCRREKWVGEKKYLSRTKVDLPERTQRRGARVHRMRQKR